MKINSVFSREILDSRGNPTVEVDLTISDSSGKLFTGRGVAPSGASTGIHEAIELRDGEKRYLGKGVKKAVSNVNNQIKEKLISLKEGDYNQSEIDNLMIELDGTENKANLGANAIVATSMAFQRALSSLNSIPTYKNIAKLYSNKNKLKIPRPTLNIINGGKHAGGELAIQEFMIVPQFDSFTENIRVASEVYHILGKILVKKYGVSARNVGDEGGYAPSIDSAEESFDSILSAIDEAGYKNEVKLAIDSAASSFYITDGNDKGKYKINGIMNKEELLEYYIGLTKSYPITFIEDPFDEEDFSSFSELNLKLKGNPMIVGDDLLVTNPERIKIGIEKKSCNALLLKLNQIGTITEAIEAGKMVKEAGWNIIVSHRSGETEDNFIADFSVGIGSDYIKTGAPARGERTSKYNQFLRIEEEI